MGSGASKGVESSSTQDEQAFYAERPVRVSCAATMRDMPLPMAESVHANDTKHGHCQDTTVYKYADPEMYYVILLQFSPSLVQHLSDLPSAPGESGPSSSRQSTLDEHVRERIASELSTQSTRGRASGEDPPRSGAGESIQGELEGEEYQELTGAAAGARRNHPKGRRAQRKAKYRKELS
jgi:hypothetical protein